MKRFTDFKIRKELLNAIDEMGFEEPTPIQEEAYSPILAGRDFVGIAQTGTGKTMAYLLPLLQSLKYSDQPNPRVLILVPTRELVIQIVEQIEKLTPYLTIRTLGVFGGTNINTQKQAIIEGLDIIVGTPRRLYDLALSNVLRLNGIKKLVIDEVDIMLDFGYKTQLRDIFDHLPDKRQNLLFSATMTTYVDEMIDGVLVNPLKKTISVSGTPLETISQERYDVQNFYTKANLVNHLLADMEAHGKVLVFVASKASADLLFEILEFGAEASMIHAGKEQNYRTNSIQKFTDGTSRILIATDVIARGIDIEGITTVISLDTPAYPENYMHRIGRTGRAGQAGRAILMTTEKEGASKDAIEALMNYTIPHQDFPDEVAINYQLTPEEKDKPVDHDAAYDALPAPETGASFHEKSLKNQKVKIEKKPYGELMKEKFNKPIRRGDKIQNQKKKKKRK